MSVLFIWQNPEPESHAMLLTGLGVLGLIARRRKMRQE
ncbi:MAG: PEP-CTERM sorting domain-containing protein [Betaproteobacteria bacterium]|nr:PEP-CTERM sorting domain-containing protein [Betaproteobacteria bacterium]